MYKYVCVCFVCVDSEFSKGCVLRAISEQVLAATPHKTPTVRPPAP